MSGRILFGGASAYQTYRAFSRFVRAVPLTLIYQTDETYRVPVRLTELSKGELMEGGGGLVCDADSALQGYDPGKWILVLFSPDIIMNHNGRIPGFIRRHHGTEDNPVPGICLPDRSSRISMHFAAEYLPSSGISREPVGKTFRTVIISFFPCILRIHRLAVILGRSLDQIPLCVEQTDPVLDKHDIFPEALCTRRRNDSLLCKAVFFPGEITIPFCPRRFYDHRSEQSMVTVISHIPEGLYDTCPIFPVCVPEISLALTCSYCLLHFIIPYINAGIADRIIL